MNSFGDERPELGARLGMEFGDCSIAAAAAARRAEELLTAPQYSEVREPRELLVAGEWPSTIPEVMHTVPVSPVVELDGGRDVQFWVARKGSSDDGIFSMVAVTRGDVALPVASFTRRAGSACDYVQLGEEMTDEALVVTPPDEFSRLDLVEALRKQLSTDPRLYPWEELRGTWFDVTVIDIRTDLRELMVGDREWVKGRWREAAELVAVHDVCTDTSTDKSDYGHRLGWRGRRVYQAARSKLEEFFGDPSIQQVQFGDLPGSSNEVAHAVLLKEAFIRLGYQPSDGLTAPARRVADLLEVAGKFDRLLGEFEPATERVIDLAGRLALRGDQPMRVVKAGVNIGKTTADAEFFITVKPVNASTHQVTVAGRPVAMDDQPPSHLHTVVLDRCTQPDINPQEARELAELMGQIDQP